MDKEKELREQEPAEEQKPEVRINGKLYRLRFDLWALEQIEEEFGGVRQAFEAMKSGSTVKAIRKLFKIMANCQRNVDGMPEDVTGDEIGSHESLAKLKEISGALRAAIEKGSESETADGGAASDKKANPLDREYERKNG
jgi:hypothetical protein